LPFLDGGNSLDNVFEQVATKPGVSAEIKHPQYCRFPRSGGGGNLGGDAVGTL
jgi:hypothetical protein